MATFHLCNLLNINYLILTLKYKSKIEAVFCEPLPPLEVRYMFKLLIHQECLLHESFTQQKFLYTSYGLLRSRDLCPNQADRSPSPDVK